MAMAKWSKAYVSVPVSAKPTFVWNFPVQQKVDTKLAVKDAHVRRFFNKSYTSDEDLVGAVTLWLVCKMPINSLDDYLAAIEPESRFMEDCFYNPRLLRRRQAHAYGPDFKNLIEGWWDKWTKPPQTTV